MEYIYVGKIVNTHGIKGEVKITSDFKYKSNAFIQGISLFIGSNHEKQVIASYRYHKIYDMITFEGINDINDVLKYKNSSVYVKKEDINIDGLINDDLIGFKVYMNNLIGEVEDIKKGVRYDYLLVSGNLIPNLPAFINKIDEGKKEIYLNNWEGLINEN
ncbi:MAG: ribosome maturation factor RimM [Bacilli bacterium]|nr:ribosome maturation factor RimM [Bacilli bacterium]